MAGQPCDWRELKSHDARTVADLAHKYGWMVVGAVEPTWAANRNHIDESLVMVMGAHDGNSAVRILAHWIDVDRHGIADHMDFTVQDITAALEVTAQRHVRHNAESIVRSLIVQHGVIDLDAEVA